MRESDLTVGPGMSKHKCSPLFKIAFVLVRLDHVASRIVNPDHSIM
jgi:hypothetical protein